MSTSHGWKLSVLVLIFVAACASQTATPAHGQGMMAAPDDTPLLYDRARAFRAIVVASTAEGFEKNPVPVKGTNCVYLPLTIETVLKGDLKPGPLRLDVHNALPALLVQRDKDTAHRYLLVVQQDKKTNYLGGGMVYTDLARCYLADGGLEKVAKAFAEANDDAPAALVKLCNNLLGDKDVSASASATRHVCELLARLAAKTDEASWKTLDKATIQSVLDRAASQLRAGAAVDATALVLNAVADRTDNPEGTKVPDANLAEPARKWLATQLEAPTPAWSPDYQQVAAVTPVINLLGRLKDKDAKDLLVKQAQNQRWSALRRTIQSAFKDLLTPEDQKALTPAGGDFPRGIRNIKRIDGPLPPVPVE
jgi:hypothetical protein